MEYRIFSKLASIILDLEAIKVTKIFNEKEKITATMKLHNKKKPTRFQQIHGITEILFTIGKPNYEEREFIKKRKKEGKKFATFLYRWTKD